MSDGLVGRSPELAVVRGFLAGLPVRSSCLVIEGEAGIGKTTIWRETLRLARAQGCRVLASRPAEIEAKLSYAALTDLLADAGIEVFERLPEPQRRALEVALLLADARGRPPERRALFTGFCRALEVLAERRPVVVAVDDVQWADRPSLAALEFLARRLGDRGVGVLLSMRTGGAEPGRSSLTRALSEAGAERIALGPLNLAALHALIVRETGVGLARPVLVRIADAAQGNPFYALEIARELLKRDAPLPGEALPVPHDVSRLVAARIARFPAHSREELLAAAMLSHPSTELLDQQALDDAEAAGLVEVVDGRVRFVHPLFASTLRAAAPSRQRRRIHQRLADSLTDPEERARHLALAARGPDEQIAAALVGAAAVARDRGAPDGAADLLELAIRLTPPDQAQQTRARMIVGAEDHFHAGNPVRARALAEAVADSAAGASRGHALRVLGEIRYHDDSFAEAIPLFERARSLLPDDDPRLVELHVNLAYARVSLGDLPGAAPDAARAREAAAHIGDDGARAVALAASTIVDEYLGRPASLDVIDEVLRLEDPDLPVVMPVRPSLIAGVLLFFHDQLDRAATVQGTLRQRTLDRGQDGDLPLVAAHLSMAERTRGRLDSALSAADEGCEIARQLGGLTTLVPVLAERCFVEAITGEVDGARADGAEALALASQIGYGLGESWARFAVGFLELSVGDVAAAAAVLEPIASAVASRGVCDPLSATYLHDQIEALIRLGQLERAERLTGLLEAHGRASQRQSVQAVTERSKSLLLAARGELDAARFAIERALACQDGLEMPLELGRTLLAHGGLERRVRHKRLAQESLTRALAVFEALPAPLWAARARAELRRVGTRASVSGGQLTGSEQRVAELAAAGLTNRETADRLFISPKTVEAHLARVYRKLGVSSRTELRARMNRRGQAGAV